LPKILGHESDFDRLHNLFDCAKWTLVSVDDAQELFMVGSIVAMVVISGIGFLMAHAFKY
jgi:hypothetical protein